MAKKEPISLLDFIEEYHLAPLPIEEIAVAASKVQDDESLAEAAEAYLDAKSVFEQQLDRIGLEIG